MSLGACTGSEVDGTVSGTDPVTEDAIPITAPNTTTEDSGLLSGPPSTLAVTADLPPALPPVDLGDDPDLNSFAGLCFAGDMIGCDTLFEISPVGSTFEAYADSCGGRNEPGLACVDRYSGASDVAGTELIQGVGAGTWVGVVGWTPYFTEAVAQASSLEATGARILATGDYPSLAPGYWLIYIAPSSSGPETAAGCEQLGVLCLQALASDQSLTAASGPPFGPWTAILSSIGTDIEGAYDTAVQEAINVFPASVEIAPQHGASNPSTGVLLSADYPSLRGGFWVPYAGQFDSEADARAFCQSLLAAEGASDCAARPLATWGEQ